MSLPNYFTVVSLQNQEKNLGLFVTLLASLASLFDAMGAVPFDAIGIMVALQQVVLPAFCITFS